MSKDPEDNEFNNDFSPEDFAAQLRRMLSGQGDINIEQMFKMSGNSADNAVIGQILEALKHAAANPTPGSGVDISAARTSALRTVSKRRQNSDDLDRFKSQLDSTYTLANSWLDETTAFKSGSKLPKVISAPEWVTLTIDTWAEITTPISESLVTAATDTISSDIPPELQEIMSGSGPKNVFKRLNEAMFTEQLGQIVGKLATEVFSGGDFGVPVISDEAHSGGTFIAENALGFIDDLKDQKQDALIFLVIRELASSRLFKNAPWLQHHLVSAMVDFARGVEIDTSHFHDLAENFDPQNPEEISRAISSGALIPPKTELQEQAHARISLLLALIEGWIMTVTAEAAKHLPHAHAIAEMIARRRATGGPAEHAFAAFIGLELRPKKYREAAAIWKKLADHGDIAKRDALWQHPDLLPTEEELARPGLLFERLGMAGQNPEDVGDDLDRDLEKLLDGGYQDTGTQPQPGFDPPPSDKE